MYVLIVLHNSYGFDVYNFNSFYLHALNFLHAISSLIFNHFLSWTISGVLSLGGLFHFFSSKSTQTYLE